MEGYFEYTASGIDAHYKQERYLKEASDYRLISTVSAEKKSMKKNFGAPVLPGKYDKAYMQYLEVPRVYTHMRKPVGN